MKSSRLWIKYSLIRVALFAGVLAGLLALKVEPWIAALAAAIIGATVSFIFLRPQTDAVALSFRDRIAAPPRDVDEDAEDKRG